jgi:hypothetical protein
MGYFVKIVESTCRIPNEHRAAIMKIWKELNKPENNHLKTGGTFRGGRQTEFCYAWMDADYDKTCKTPEAILEMLGFDFDVQKSGDVLIKGYDNKTGAEELFFTRVNHLLTGMIKWKGEDGVKYQWKYSNASDEKKKSESTRNQPTVQQKLTEEAIDYANKENESYGADWKESFTKRYTEGLIEACGKQAAVFSNGSERAMTAALKEYVYSEKTAEATPTAQAKKKRSAP